MVDVHLQHMVDVYLQHMVNVYVQHLLRFELYWSTLRARKAHYKYHYKYI